MTEFSHTVTATAPGHTVVAVTGELDTHTAGRFKLALLDLVEDGARLVVDLSDLDFIDSSGLSVFIAVHKRSVPRGAEVVLDRVPPFLSRILTITGLDQVIPVLRVAEAS
ncbi:STAS domain-containing protein [Actinokineospora sp. NBRC 105648]|uniref:STAS domain-containing protein n=1 Tax=Actinokineospora sp. NBRC 105648 TaxID=3032206 RepID=UPI0024A192CC|nr:STAS domain-containing protein [Actinokineospora sp. NBRC 105648]GLZ40180.1 hypothetical protein Acsp05_38040 [Actinokineospora sp. NBRC 105648]